MSIPEYTYEDLVGLHEEGDYEKLAHWVLALAEKRKRSLGYLLSVVKSKSGESVNIDNDRDREDDGNEALSLIWQWFRAEDEEGMEKYKNFWKQAFGITNGLKQLENRLRGSKFGKFKEILQAQYPSGGMHKNEGLRLHRMCREAMSADQETFRKERLNISDYYGLADWPELFEKGFLKEGETIKKLHSYYFKHSNVEDGGERTSPWTEEQVREACLLALDYVEKYSMVKQLKEAMVKEGWFELINAVATDYIAVFGQNKDGEGNEDQAAEPYDKNELGSGALNSGKPSDQFLKASQDEVVQEFKLFWDELDREIRIVILEVILAEKKATTHELAKKYGKSHGTWHNRIKPAITKLLEFGEEYGDEDHSLICRSLKKFFENEDLGTLLPIDETNE